MPKPYPILLSVALAAGCGGGADQPKFPDLSQVSGVVKRGGQPVKGGAVQFQSEPDRPEFLVNSEVGSDGTFTLSTVRTTDKTGERKTGAPAGKYKVVYQPPLGDQTAGGQLTPINAPGSFEVKAGPNDLMIELPKK